MSNSSSSDRKINVKCTDEDVEMYISTHMAEIRQADSITDYINEIIIGETESKKLKY